MSTQRAFVIQFLQRPGSDDGFTGRAEHVGSGEAVHFNTPDELIVFLSRLNGQVVRPAAKPRADAAAAGAGAPDAARPRRPRRSAPS
ncbi:MAG: hypothetical protein U0842_14200 [Candidatus Binatia bacterium]|jgi:hypothetical protein